MSDAVRTFEACFAEYVGADYAIALCNGTATLHTALAAMGVEAGHEVAVPPLTMASTTIAVLHAGAVPVFTDIHPETWLIDDTGDDRDAWIDVDLYGLCSDSIGWATIHDAAQTLRKHQKGAAFTSYSFQASKILPLGEGGMLVTDDGELATAARSLSSLGYAMAADQPRIDKDTLKDRNAVRHHLLGWNYRMAPAVAEKGVFDLTRAEALKAHRQYCAELYRQAIGDCAWITKQYIPAGWSHDYWCYPIALQSADLWQDFTDAIVRHGGERPYGAWRLTYQEPAFRHLAEDGTCPVAEDLQPRLVQLQTNDGLTIMDNADAVAAVIKEIGG